MADEDTSRRRPGEVWSEFDPSSRREESYRINPRTGEKEIFVRSPIGGYYQELEYVVLWPDGTVADFGE